MELALPLDKMSTADKLAAMEHLWESLCRTPEDVPSPPWHAEVLSAREKRVRLGKAKFANLEAVKERSRKPTQ